MEARTGRTVYEQPPGLFIEHTDKFIVDDNDMDSDTVQGKWSSAENPRPILKRCNTRQ